MLIGLVASGVGAMWLVYTLVRTWEAIRIGAYVGTALGQALAADQAAPAEVRVSLKRRLAA